MIKNHERDSAEDRPLEAPPLSASEKPATSAETAGSAPRERRVWRNMLMLPVSGLTGGVAAWALMGLFSGYFDVEDGSDQLGAQGGGAPAPVAEEVLEELAQQRTASYRNTALAIGLFGFAVGGLLGAGTGAARRSVRTAVLCTAGGLLLGGLFGAVGGYASIWVMEQLALTRLPTRFQNLGSQATAWLTVAVGIGLGLSLPGGRWRRVAASTGGSVVAATAACAAYVVLAAILFPLENSDLPVPEGNLNRLLWATMTAGLIGVALARTGATTGSPSSTGNSAA